MTDHPGSQTGTTLYALLRDARDEGAWAAFVGRYAPRIFRWCRQRGLQEADAEDVTQDVLSRLARKLGEFRYDRSRGTFRGWLKTLTHHAWADFMAARNRAGAAAGHPAAHDRLASVEARDDLARQLAAAFDLELLDEARARVQARVEPRTWDAFQGLAVDGRPGAEVAASLGLSVAAVYMARSRVQKLLRDELTLLDPG